MSAPLRPAARTRTRSSPPCGSGSGCSWTAISPSRIVAARMGADACTRARACVRRGDLAHSAQGFVRRPSKRRLTRRRSGTSPAMSIPSCRHLAHLRRSGARAGSGSSGRPAALRRPARRGRAAGRRPRRAADPRLPGRRRVARHDDAVAARRRLAHQARGIRANVACSEVACARLEERLEALAERTGGRVTIIGQSRGGVFAKALGARRPDLVAGVIGARLPVALAAGRPSRRARAGRRRRDARQRAAAGLFSWRCLRGECCARFRARARGPVPARGRLRLAVLALGRDRRLALVPGSGRVVRRGARLALRHEPQRRRLPGDRPGALELRSGEGWAQAA